jgi:hypothetical protein
MKFLIIQIWDSHCHNGPAFAELAKITSKSTKDYCELHGYDYFFMDKNPDPSRQISWGRSYLIKEKLKDYDWILACDCDLMIMNHTIKLEHLISDKHSVVVAANEGNIDRINTGSILWKNSLFSYQLLDKMYEDEEFANKGYWEQSTLIKLIKNQPELLEKIKIVSPRLMNSFYHFFFENENSNYKHGDFCVHLAGSGNNYRFNELQKFEKLIIKPLSNIDIPIISLQYN